MSSKRTHYREMISTQAVIAHEWETRKLRNKDFSLRSFARFLHLSPSFLSYILSGKSRLSPASASDVADILKLEPLDKQYFCDLATVETERSGLRSRVAKSRIKKYQETPNVQMLTEDKFCLVNDWWHPAIVELAKTKDFVCEIPWIAKRIGITQSKVIDALVRLEEVGVIRFISSQTFEVTMANPSVPGGFPSSAIRNYHASLLGHATRALETQSINERTVSSHTIAFPRERFKEVEDRIREFRLSLAKEIETMGEPNEVYALCLQFFRLTEK